MSEDINLSNYMPEKAKDVQYYDHYEQQLKQTQIHKARKFIKHNCIKYNKDGQSFICEPIEGYNTRTYQMKKCPDGRFTCNCQFISSQNKRIRAGILHEDDMKPCSHIAALIIMFREKRFQGGSHGR